jgi:hypothetical protein
VIHIVQADGVVRVKIELGPNALPVEQLNLKISAHLLISKSIYHSIHLPKIPTVMSSKLVPLSCDFRLVLGQGRSSLLQHWRASSWEVWEGWQSTLISQVDNKCSILIKGLDVKARYYRSMRFHRPASDLETNIISNCADGRSGCKHLHVDMWTWQSVSHTTSRHKQSLGSPTLHFPMDGLSWYPGNTPVIVS